MNKLYILWGILLVCLFGALTVFGKKYLEVKDYKDYEANLEESAKKYMGEHIGEYPKNDDLLYLTEEQLEEYIIEKVEIEDDECSGFIVISNSNTGYKYDSYIKCNNYETKNYENMKKIS